MIKSSKVISKLMEEKNSKIITDNVQQPEDEVDIAPQLRNSEAVKQADNKGSVVEEDFFRLSSHKELENED